MSEIYLSAGLPQPQADLLDEPYWQGLTQNVLRVQQCSDCGRFQWGPEWICHRCLSAAVTFVEVAPQGVIYSYERVWHPVHPALKEQGPYLVVLVTLPHADEIRLVGNLLGDPQQLVNIGAPVEGVFEHHNKAEPSFSLLQWRCI